MLYKFMYMCYDLFMQAISYTHARNNLAEVSDTVCTDRNPVLITRQGGPSVVMLSWDDYRSLEETSYLLRSPKNAARLAEAIAEAEATGGTPQQLIEE